MRRSTAAAVGTVTGAALIMAVRLSVTTTPLAAAPPAFDLSEAEANGQGAAAGGEPTPKPSKSRAKEKAAAATDAPGKNDGGDAAEEPAAEPTRNAGGLKDGKYTGNPVTHPYGTVQVAITISGGKITAAQVSAPSTGNSAAINAGAVPRLKKQTLSSQSAEVDAVSGATYTSTSYVESLQAALDAAKA